MTTSAPNTNAGAATPTPAATTPPTAGTPPSAGATTQEPPQPGSAPKAADKPTSILDTVPQSYQLKSADGSSVEAKGFVEAARKHGLAQDAAQELFASLAPTFEEQFQAKMSADRDTAVSKWADETRTDKVFGGAKLNENLGFASRTFDAVPEGAEVRQLLIETGYGNNLKVLRFLAALGKRLSPTTELVQGAPSGASAMDPEAKMAAHYERNSGG